MNILLTGGRAPATLDLARAFHRVGHNVFMAESLRGHLSEPSHAIKSNFAVPAPRQAKEAFLATLKKIILENKINLLIPTCEEIFYVSMGREQLPCTVFVESIKKLNTIHNKWMFFINAVEQDLSVPETFLIKGMDDILHAYDHSKRLVFKPIYSRFAARTLIMPPLEQALSTLKFDTNSPWVAQIFIQGKEICTYSIAHNGHITAHTAYASTLTAGQGATISFQNIHHLGIFEWVNTFVKKNQITGQIAFDFIETPDGQIFALECNPRATSGIHLLASHPQFIEAFLNPQLNCITPAHERSYMLTTAMLSLGLTRAIKKKRFVRWLKTFFTSKDVILDFKDMLPYMLQFRSILTYFKMARDRDISPLEATTFDIEWNGEE